MNYALKEGNPQWLQIMLDRGACPFSLSGLPDSMIVTEPSPTVATPMVFLFLTASHAVPEALGQLLRRQLELVDRQRCLDLFALWACQSVLDRDLVWIVQLAFETYKE